ncbi:hypothetical protein GWI33_007843 [Rhynchophorus ferrugineus]|uniref:Uncharacterized protein n=1 Tax=Rhynchophorus ferrugineus TaxID=354439 RepID=A0A834MEK4_RHYFE|nr:hypothetical protein GWI33_007843 [Rhynchophorus ferrugineus]
MNTNKNENSDNKISPVYLSDVSWRDRSPCYCGQHYMHKISRREQESSEEESCSKEELFEVDSSWKDESSHDDSMCCCGHYLMGKESCGLKKSSWEGYDSLCYCCEYAIRKVSIGSEENSSSNGESSGVDSSSNDELSQDGSECYCGLHLKPKESPNQEEQSAEDASCGEQSSSDDSSTNEESCDRLEGYSVQNPYTKTEDRKVHELSSRPQSSNIGLEGGSCPYSAPEYAISVTEEGSDN